ncbi:hypothetical protein [Cupriavidus necator]|nr:hypothetical protein [Cupriavidus necator]
MAVDFSLLPTENTEAVARPSRILWAIVHLATASVLALGILRFWPAQLPTNTFKFWVTLIIFPLGIPLFVVLRRYSYFEGRKLDAEMQREAAHEYNEAVFAAASRPLILLGSAFRFSAERRENASSAVRSGSVNLTTRDALASDSDPVKARWIEVPGGKLDSEMDDSARQVAVTRWLYSELLADMAKAIRALPSRSGIEVSLWLSGELDREAYVALWQECWTERRLPSSMQIADEDTPSGIGIMDDWLDRIVAEEATQVTRLVVAIQLHPVIGNSPPTGTCEAGTALLLASDVLVRKHALTACASLHRPVWGDVDAPEAMLANALKWADVTAEKIPSGWKSGLSVDQSSKLHEAARQLGLEATPTDIDQTIGYAGVASPWLALACAVDALSEQTPCQIIVTAEQRTMLTAVVRRDADKDVTRDSDRTQADS